MSRRVDATLVYDGDCAFCTASVALLPRLRLAEVRVVAWQHADLDALGVTAAECERAVQWVPAVGRPRSGAPAVAALLSASGGLWRLLGAATRVPPVSWLAALVYRAVADNRHRLPGGTPACALPPSERPGASSGSAA
ncbi:MAG TPA: DUF393 domain-containing protein [Mycobacteriales bacterium]|nr:DUF393 domain-containing protein [Mycobacteriales bacterium]